LAALKPLRRPRLWLGAWCSAIALVVLFSLLPAPALPQVPPGGDKLEHFASYFALAAGAVQLFANRRALLAAGSGLAALGVALELAQSMFTSTRLMDGMDALANTAGVLAGLAMALTPWRNALLDFDWRV
jgi:VanZ family protein